MLCSKYHDNHTVRTCFPLLQGLSHGEGWSLSQTTPAEHTLPPLGVGRTEFLKPGSNRRFEGNGPLSVGRLEPYVKEGMRAHSQQQLQQQQQLSSAAELPQQVREETATTLDHGGGSRARPNPYLTQQSLLQQRIKAQLLKAAQRRFSVTRHDQGGRDEASGIINGSQRNDVTKQDFNMAPEIQNTDGSRGLQIQERNENFRSRDSAPHLQERAGAGAAPGRAAPGRAAPGRAAPGRAAPQGGTSQSQDDMTELHMDGATQLIFDADTINSREPQTERFQSLVPLENSQTSQTPSLQSDLTSGGEDPMNVLPTHHSSIAAQEENSRDSYKFQEVSESDYSTGSRTESQNFGHQERDPSGQDKFLETETDVDSGNENEDENLQLQHLKLPGDNTRGVSGRKLVQNIHPRARLQSGGRGDKRRLRFPLRRRMFRLRRPKLRNTLRRNSRIGRRRPTVRENDTRDSRAGLVFPRINFQNSDTLTDMSSQNTPHQDHIIAPSSTRGYSGDLHQTSDVRQGVSYEYDEELVTNSGSISDDFGEDEVSLALQRGRDLDGLINTEVAHNVSGSVNTQSGSSNVNRSRASLFNRSSRSRRLRPRLRLPDEGSRPVSGQETPDHVNLNELSQQYSHVNTEEREGRLEEQAGEQIFRDSEVISQQDQKELSGSQQSSGNRNFSPDGLQKASINLSSGADQLTTIPTESKSDSGFSTGEQDDTSDLPRNSWSEHFPDGPSGSQTQRQYNSLQRLSARQQQQMLNRRLSERRKQNKNQSLLQSRNEFQNQSLSQYSQEQIDIKSLSQRQQQKWDSPRLLQPQQHGDNSQNSSQEQQESESQQSLSGAQQVSEGGFFRRLPPQLGDPRPANPRPRQEGGSHHLLGRHSRPAQLSHAIGPKKINENNLPTLLQSGEADSIINDQRPQPLHTFEQDNTVNVPSSQSSGSSASDIISNQQESKIQKLEATKEEESGSSASTLLSLNQSQFDHSVYVSLQASDQTQGSSSTLEHPTFQDHGSVDLQQSSVSEATRLTSEASVEHRDVRGPTAISFANDFDSSSGGTTSFPAAHHGTYPHLSAGREEGFIRNNRQLFLGRFKEKVSSRFSENQKSSGTIVDNTNRRVTSKTFSSVQRPDTNNFVADVTGLEPEDRSEGNNSHQSNFRIAGATTDTGISHSFALSSDKEVYNSPNVHTVNSAGPSNSNESSYLARPSGPEAEDGDQGSTAVSDIIYTSQSRPGGVRTTVFVGPRRIGSRQDDRILRQNSDTSTGVSQGTEQESRSIGNQGSYLSGRHQSNIRKGQVSVEMRGEGMNFNRNLGSTLVGSQVSSPRGQDSGSRRSQYSRLRGGGSILRVGHGSQDETHQTARFRVDQVSGFPGSQALDFERDDRSSIREDHREAQSASLAVGQDAGEKRDQVSEDKTFDVWGSHLHDVRHNFSDNPSQQRYSENDASSHMEEISDTLRHQRPEIKINQDTDNQPNDLIRGSDDLQNVRSEALLLDVQSLATDSRISSNKFMSEVSSPETTPSPSLRGHTHLSRRNFLLGQSRKPASNRRNYHSGQSGTATNSHGQPAFSFRRRPEAAAISAGSFQQSEEDLFSDSAQGIRSSTGVSASSISGPGSISERVSSSLYSHERIPGSQVVGLGGFAASAKWTKGNDPLELPESRFRQPTPAARDHHQHGDSLQGSYRASTGRGTRKFLDSLSGMDKNVKEGMLLRSLAAMLRGEDYLEQWAATGDLEADSSHSQLRHIPETGQCSTLCSLLCFYLRFSFSLPLPLSFVFLPHSR